MRSRAPGAAIFRRWVVTFPDAVPDPAASPTGPITGRPSSPSLPGIPSAIHSTASKTSGVVCAVCVLCSVASLPVPETTLVRLAVRHFGISGAAVELKSTVDIASAY